MAQKKNYRLTKLACYTGYVTQAIVINLAPLFFVIFSEDYHIDDAGLGTLVLINFVTQMLTDIVAVRLTSKLSMRLCAVLANALCSAGLVFLGLLPMLFPNAVYVALIIATVVYSVGGGLTEVVISPIVDAIPIEEPEGASSKKAAAMALLHSFYCWGQMAVVLISTLLMLIMGDRLWMVIPFIWAVIPFVNSFAFMYVPMPHFVTEEERTPLGKIVFSKLFIIGAVLMICSGASELTIAQWASMLMEKGLGIPKVLGDILGPCAFALCMGIGRMIYGLLGRRLPLAFSLLGCSLLCVASYLMITVFRSPVIALLGCSLCGLAVSLMWPGVLSLTSNKFPMGGAALFSLLAICGDTGCSVGPWLTGFVSKMADTEKLSALKLFSGMDASEISLKAGILAAIVFPIIMIFAVLAFIHTSKGKKDA